MEEKQKNADNTAKKLPGKPFKRGKDERRNLNGRPKGSKNFSTLFEEVAKEVAEALRLGKKPNAVQIELVKRGIREGLAGNFSFFKDLMDRIYGKAKEFVSLESDVKLQSIKEFTESIRKLADKKYGKSGGSKQKGDREDEKVSSETL